VALLIAGFGVKIGLVPLHVWMPPTYTAAPVPAAAALSGAAVKAGVIGLIRFLPFHTALPGWGGVLVVAGFFSAFYGVAIGVTRTNPKTVLACSSISQMGLIAAVLGMGLGHGDPGIALIVAFYAAHHVLVKGGLFLAIGVAPLVAARRRRWIVLLPAAVVALGLAGLPLTGGAMAKLAIKAPPSEGVVGGGVVGALGSLSAAGTALLMLHFLGRLAAAAPRGGPRPAAGTIVCVWAWLAVAAAAVVMPWALYAPLGLGAASDALAPGALAAAAWPVLLGGAAAVALRRWGHRLPHPPAGDIGGTVARAAVAAGRIGAAAGRLDAFARQWTVAGACLLAVAVLLALAMLAGS
jgi:formate hydrogenlyase subunit 3/multisubunit Na+/H+ antiporter MnhD subunit